MRILNARLGTGRPVLLYFDIEVGDRDLRVVNMYLKRNFAGDLRIYAPSPGDKRVVTFSKPFADKIIAAAEAALKERVAHGTNSQAA